MVDKERLTEADQREAPYWIDVKNGNEDEPIPEILLQYICLLVAFQWYIVPEDEYQYDREPKWSDAYTCRIEE